MIHAQTKSINESKLKTTFKPMTALDKNRNFDTCACQTNFVVVYVYDSDEFLCLTKTKFLHGYILPYVYISLLGDYSKSLFKHPVCEM